MVETCLIETGIKVVVVWKNNVETIKLNRDRSVSVNCECFDVCSFHQQTFISSTANTTALATTQYHQLYI